MSTARLSAKASESAHQIAIFDYVEIAARYGFEKADLHKETGTLKRGNVDYLTKALPMLNWFHAIPNGGARGDNARSRAIRGSQLKSEGVKKGVYDMFLPYPANGFHGLYIELKTPERRPKTARGIGGVSPEQKIFGSYANSSGYKAVVAYGADEAISVLKEYLRGRE